MGFRNEWKRDGRGRYGNGRRTKTVDGKADVEEK